MKERKWRLTASRFGEVIQATEARDIQLLCKSLCDGGSFQTPATIHGSTWEKTAVKAYEEKTGKIATNCGLVVHPSWPFLGASPDGYVDNDIVLEVKCPYNGRNSMIKPGKFFPFLKHDGESVTLKKTHKYYFQVIGQLALSGRKNCHFIVYTHVDLLVLQIPHDPQFFTEKMLPSLVTFYKTHYRPYLASRL